MHKKTKAALAVAALIAGASQAGDRGQFEITPYVGHAQVRIDGQYLEFGDSETFDQWIAGISAGYRAPFAPGSSFTVTQGFHGTATHASPSNEYAVDIAMPIGTGVYAARSGVVVQIAYSNYSGGTDPEVDGPRANIVRILHEDGTLALYAHLDRASVRVRPGEQVRAGQYIADSGNTGFTTGPHLHFAILKNRGFDLVSVPFVFSGAGGTTTEPQQGQTLTSLQ